MSKRTRSDSPDKVCAKDSCGRPLRARGLCASHYNQAHQTKRHYKRLVSCAWCGTEVLKHSGGGRKYGQVCSDQCRQHLATPYSVLPADHWARWYGKVSNWTPPKPKMARPAFISNQCDECGNRFIEVNHNNYSSYCSAQCANRVSRRARKAREHQASGSYRWVEVIKVWIAGGKACAYCDTIMTEQPDPDHVTPLSRGGRNDMGNIVACCHLCNSDKCDLTLDEWAVERIRLGKPPLRYVLDRDDPRFNHLTLDPAQGAAWRHSIAA